MHPDLNELPAWTDQYFLKTKAAVGRFGDKQVTYAVFMRRPVVSAPRLAVEWLRHRRSERARALEDPLGDRDV